MPLRHRNVVKQPCSRRWALVLAALGAVYSAAPLYAFEAWQISVGYDQLFNALGPTIPGGAGVKISQVEAPETGGKYYPDATSTEFTADFDPLGQPVTFIDGSGNAGAGTSSHATTTVGRWMYGNTFGLARTANEVTVYEANSWLLNVLKYTGVEEPVAQDFRVQNHSWVGTVNPNNPSSDVPILKRYDYLIDVNNITAIVGASNNDSSIPTSHQRLLASSMNAIVVGRSDGRHSRGVTGSAYHGGRIKPDIVSLASVTSAATAQVSSAAALLHSAAAGGDASQNETMKAIIMAGATKQEFANFVDPFTGQINAWARTQTQPLDDLFGAGELNVFNSYRIFAGGKHAGSAEEPVSSAESFGWDYRDLRNDAEVGDIYYKFVVPEGITTTDVSIMLAWNAKVIDANPSNESIFTPSDTLQNLDLKLYDSTTGFQATLVDQSVSTLDNVEHIYLQNLAAGTYTLAVTGAAGIDYGLAWRMATLAVLPTADFNGDGEVDGTDLVTWQQNVGKLVNAQRSQGDANGDGAVDGADLAVFNAQVILAPPDDPPPLLQALAIHAVPEPGALGLVVVAGVMIARTMRRVRQSGLLV